MIINSFPLYCYFSSYGIPDDIETLMPYLLTTDQCSSLISDKFIDLEGFRFRVENTERFTIKHFLKGKRLTSFKCFVIIKCSGNRSDDGTCERGPAFEYRGRVRNFF